MNNEKMTRLFFLPFLLLGFLLLVACFFFLFFLIQSLEGVYLLLSFVLLLLFFPLAVLLGVYLLSRYFTSAAEWLGSPISDELRKFAYGKLSLSSSILLAVVAVLLLLGLAMADRFFFTLAAALVLGGVVFASLLRVLLRKSLL